MRTLESKIPAEIVGLQFSNIERQILNHLSDGEAHTIEELKTYDRFVDDKTIQTHIHTLRRKITDSRFRIYSGHEKDKLVYRLVSLLSIHKIHF